MFSGCRVTASGLISVWLPNVTQNEDRLSSKRGGSRFARRMASSMARMPRPRFSTECPTLGIVVRPDLSGFCPDSR